MKTVKELPRKYQILLVQPSVLTLTNRRINNKLLILEYFTGIN